MVVVEIRPDAAQVGDRLEVGQNTTPPRVRRDGRDLMQSTAAPLDLQPVAARPLAAAFAAKVVAAKSAAWNGPRVDHRLDETTEQEIVHAHKGRVVLAAFGDFDPSREPVVLVHGMTGSGQELVALAQRLTAAGRQVLMALYDDTGTETHQSGAQLAQALLALRARHYAPGARLDIVGHSVGGIVARAALNTLADPSWMAPAAAPAAMPRAGFGNVRLRTVDTPWDGFEHEPVKPQDSFVGKLIAAFTSVVRFLMRLVGLAGLFQMRGSSDMFARLYGVTLAGVDIRHHAAYQPGVTDWITSIPELEPARALAMVRFIVDGELPGELRLRNLALALRQDARFQELRAAAVRAVQDGTLRLEAGPALVAELTRLYDATMPRFLGTHADVVQDRPGTDDLVDAIVAELAPERA